MRERGGMRGGEGEREGERERERGREGVREGEREREAEREREGARDDSDQRPQRVAVRRDEQQPPGPHLRIKTRLFIFQNSSCHFSKHVFSFFKTGNQRKRLFLSLQSFFNMFEGVVENGRFL